ncbi:MAG: LPS export ABC transporter permease LptF [Paracoccaceae bacterium]
MAKFDRYLLSQLLVLFGFFALVLVMVYWLNRAVVLFDQLIANGHSAMVFLEFSALTLPNVIRLVLPIAAFAASMFCANRLASDSELVVVQSTGYSPYRLVRPVFIFGILVALMLSVLTHILVPTSLTQLEKRRAEISSNSTARLLQEGTFMHPAKGITFYIKEISVGGVMSSIFLADSRDPDNQTTYSATQAMLVRSDTGPKLIMLDGMAQNLRHADNRLSTTRFSEFVFDIGSLLAESGLGKLGPNQLPTSVLLWPTEFDIESAGSTRAKMLQTGHERISQSLLCIVVSVLGFAALLVGGYSRFGLWRQMLGALVLFILLKSFDNLMNDLARQDPKNWPLVYASTVAGLAGVFAILWLSARPALFTRRRRLATK